MKKRAIRYRQLTEKQLEDEDANQLAMIREWGWPKEEIMQRIEDQERKDKEQYDQSQEQWKKMKAKFRRNGRKVE